MSVEVLEEEAAIFSTDGQHPQELPVGAAITVRRAAQPVRVVHGTQAGTFLQRVRQKFELPTGQG